MRPPRRRKSRSSGRFAGSPVRVRRGILALGILTGVGALVSSVGASEPPGWTVSTANFGVALFGGDASLTAVGGAEAPLAYVAKGVEHRLTRVVSERREDAGRTYRVATDEPGRTAVVTVEGTADGVAVTWGLRPAAGVEAMRTTIAGSPDLHFLGTGQRTRWVDMRGTVVPLKVWNTCESSAPSPFFASTGGFGAWFSTPAVGRIAFPGAADGTAFACELGQPPCPVGDAVAAVRVCLKASSTAFEIARGTPERLVSWFSERVGRPKAPWLPQLALIRAARPRLGLGRADRGHRAAPRAAAPDRVDRARQSLGGRGRLQPVLRRSLVRPGAVSRPEGSDEGVHAAGVRLMLWISPQIKRAECPAPDLPDGWLTGDDQITIRGLTRPDVSARLRRCPASARRARRRRFQGRRGDEVDLEDAPVAAGKGTVVQEQYPLLYAAAAAKAMGNRPFGSLFRSFVPGSTSLLGGIVGPDQRHTWNGLSGAIKAAQTAGVAVTGVGIGHRRLQRRRPHARAVRPVGAVRGAHPDLRGRRRPHERDLLGSRPRRRRVVPRVRDAALRARPGALRAGAGGEQDRRPRRPGPRAHLARRRSAWASELEFTVGPNLLAAPVRRVVTPAGALGPGVPAAGTGWTLLRVTRQGSTTVTRCRARVTSRSISGAVRLSRSTPGHRRSGPSRGPSTTSCASTGRAGSSLPGGARRVGQRIGHRAGSRTDADEDHGHDRAGAARAAARHHRRATGVWGHLGRGRLAEGAPG